jgi:pilus assembly protein FimV
MAHKFRLHWVAVAVAVLLPVVEASALTLGRARGAVLIGRPLDLAIPVTLDTAGGDEPCVEGDVFYGEHRVEQRLNVRWEPGPDRAGVLRVNLPVLVDEPMVTLYLRVGCTQRMTRRYVLLAELPPEQEPAVPLVAGPRPGAASAPRAPQGQAIAEARAADERRRGLTTPVQRPGEAGTVPGRDAGRATAEPAAAAAVPAGPAARAPSRERRAAARTGPREPRTAQAPAAPARPRLRLEPIELLAEREPTLRLSTELQVPPNADPQARTWATALWQALSKPPEEAAQESQRLQAIETEMKSLRALTQQNAQALSQMTGQVEKARGERNQMAMAAAGLLVLLLLAAAGLLWLWRRGRRPSGPWYTGEETGLSDLAPASAPKPAAEAAAPRASAPQKEPVLAASAPGARGGADAPTVVMRSDAIRTSPLAPVVPAGVAQPVERTVPVEHADFQASHDGSIRMVRVDELIDIQDKANFFLSIGQHDQAIAILEGHVHDQVETSALAWLDLLDLYHSLGRRAEFSRLRAEFRQQFNAQVPEFEEFDVPSGGLEDYGRALSRIVALWPSQRVLDVIEESIFRKPGVGGADAFTLEAYRELILLYNVAREVIPADDEAGLPRPGETPATEFSHTTLESLSSLDARDKLMQPPASPRLGLDIDLDLPSPEPAVSGGPAPARPELEPLDFDTSWDSLGTDEPPKGR